MKMTLDIFADHSGISEAQLWNYVRFLRKVRPDLPRKKKTIYISNL
jgi:hypothetical protein